MALGEVRVDQLIARHLDVEMPREKRSNSLVNGFIDGERGRK